MKTKTKENRTLFFSSVVGNLLQNVLSLEESPLFDNSKKTKKVKAEIKIKYNTTKTPVDFKEIKKKIRNFESKWGILDEKSNTYFSCFINLFSTYNSLDARIDIYFFSFKKKPNSGFDFLNVLLIDNDDLSDPNMKVINSHYDTVEADMRGIICSLA